MPIGGFNEPVWHQNWKEDRQRPGNNRSEFRSLRDLWLILAVLGIAVAAVAGYVILVSWATGRPFP